MKNKKSNNLIDIVGLVLIIVPLVWFSFVKKSRFEKGIDNSLAYSQVTGSASPVGKIIQKKVLQGKENFSVLLMGRASENEFINSFFTKRGGSIESNINKLKPWASADLSSSESIEIKKAAKLQYFPKKILTYQASKFVNPKKIKLELQKKIKQVNKEKMDKAVPRNGFWFLLSTFSLVVFGSLFTYFWYSYIREKDYIKFSHKEVISFVILICFASVLSSFSSIKELDALSFICTEFGIGIQLYTRFMS